MGATFVKRPHSNIPESLSESRRRNSALVVSSRTILNLGHGLIPLLLGPGGPAYTLVTEPPLPLQSCQAGECAQPDDHRAPLTESNNELTTTSRKICSCSQSGTFNDGNLSSDSVAVLCLSTVIYCLLHSLDFCCTAAPSGISELQAGHL